ncbi:MAG TPA: ABC-type transport auxiliary lipoprotein family protein [Candidatus Desulfobacillus sp.]|nr:ABC-type transport auxiliary lipoprotein family protein [Candidatus Desulfobacillus sp.]
MPVLALALLAACGGARSVSSVATYDLGPQAAAPNNRVVASLASLDVHAAPWLESSAMQYRLAYAVSQRRQAYAESRWAATPAELLAHALRKRMLSGPAEGACRLRVELDEFVQVFDEEKSSRALLEARAQLVAPGDGAVLARHDFSLARPAASADAAGGAAALAEAAAGLSAQLRDWLGGLDAAGAGGLNIAKRCRR